MIKNRYVITALMICLTILFAPSSESFAASDKTDISKEKVIAYTNMSATIKIENPSSQVKWATSNKKFAAVLGTWGDKNNIVTISTKKEIGAFTIKATVGEKVYRCKVVVKKDGKISRAILVKTIQTKKAIKLKLKLKNNSSKTVEYGEGYLVEKFKAGRWQEMNMKDGGGAFIAVAYGLLPKCSVVKTYTLSSCYDFKDFTKGIYRIQVKSDFLNKYNYVIFDVVA
jgi:hypothetical protein